MLFGAFHISFSFAGGCDGRLDVTLLVRNPDSQFPCDANHSRWYRNRQPEQMATMMAQAKDFSIVIEKSVFGSFYSCFSLTVFVMRAGETGRVWMTNDVPRLCQSCGAKTIAGD